MTYASRGALLIVVVVGLLTWCHAYADSRQGLR